MTMAELVIDTNTLQLRLSSLEKLGAFRGGIKVPLSSVMDAEVVEKPFAAIHGLRAPGTGFPGVIALGTWRYSGGKDLVAVYRGQPGVMVELAGQRFNRLIVSTPAAQEVVRQIRTQRSLWQRLNQRPNLFGRVRPRS